MGTYHCCSRMDNSAEQMIRDILCQMKINSLTFEEFDYLIQSNFEIVDFGGKKLRQFKVDMYDRIYDKYFAEKKSRNAFYKFHRSIMIDKEHEAFEFELYAFAFTFLRKTNDKYKYIENILIQCFNEFNYKTFRCFLEYYIFLNLHKFTHLLAKEIENSYGSIGYYVINVEIKEESQYLAASTYDLNNVNEYISELVKELDELLASKYGNKFSIDVLCLFFGKHSYLLSVVSLRDDFYKKYFKAYK